MESPHIVTRKMERCGDQNVAYGWVDTMDEQSRAKATLTELFNGVKNENTPIVVERIVKDFDNIVKQVRFPGWQDTIEGRRNVKQNIRRIVRIKYKIKDEEVVSRAYSYIEMYYKIEEESILIQ